jgi:hypothetical protein
MTPLEASIGWVLRHRREYPDHRITWLERNFCVEFECSCGKVFGVRIP